MTDTINLVRGVAAAALAWQMAAVMPAAAQNKLTDVDLAPDKRGGIADMEDISKYCGTKELKVAYSDGWGGNYWRQIARAEFEAC